MQVVRWFFECVREFSNDERGKLLRFTTGSSSVPVEGFKVSVMYLDDHIFRITRLMLCITGFTVARWQAVLVRSEVNNPFGEPLPDCAYLLQPVGIDNDVVLQLWLFIVAIHAIASHIVTLELQS